MIRKILMSTVALVAISGTAFAADLPSRRAPPVFVPPIPVFSWTGFYAGGQVGYGFGRDTLNGLTTANPHGFVAGGHVGYNFAGFPGLGTGLGGLLFGVEGDAMGTDYKDTIGLVTLRQSFDATARGRVGIAVDRALFFATGGAAFTQFNESYPATFTSVSKSRVGWVVGGGVEYAITTQWALRAEYRYENFSNFYDGVASRKEIVERAMVGFDYKFDTPAAVPVVARY